MHLGVFTTYSLTKSNLLWFAFYHANKKPQTIPFYKLTGKGWILEGSKKKITKIMTARKKNV